MAAETAWPIRADGERFANGLGAGGFAGVVGEAQAGLRCLGKEGAERLGAGPPLVAAQADADNGRELRPEFGGLAEDSLGLGDGEVADGVEDPVERDPQLALAALAGSFEAGEDGLEGGGVVVAPAVDDAGSDKDLGVDHALRGEMLDHAPGGQLVVFGADQAVGHGLEGIEEAGEVCESVECLGLGQRKRVCPPHHGGQARRMAGAQLHQSRRQDGAFKMQMQLGLGEAADEGFDFRHRLSLMCAIRRPSFPFDLFKSLNQRMLQNLAVPIQVNAWSCDSD